MSRIRPPPKSSQLGRISRLQRVSGRPPHAMPVAWPSRPCSIWPTLSLLPSRSAAQCLSTAWCAMSILDVSHTAASEELSARSHLTPSARVRPATSCHASGMAVEAMLDIACPAFATKQARRTMARYMSEHNDFLSCPANVVLSKSSITVLPRVALVMSLLEPRIRTSRRPFEEPLLHVACHLGRRLRHADRPSAKNIFSRSAHCAVRWH
jgi:hypothetical protein